MQVNSIASTDRRLLVDNLVRTAMAAVASGLPIVHSTINVEIGFNKPPIPQRRKVLDPYLTQDRTTIDSWEEVAFCPAVVVTGRRKLVMTSLWTGPA